MGFLAEAATAAPGLVQTGLNVYNTIRNNERADKNLELQQGWYEYQKALQEKIFEREDTAVQRHLNDVTAAGFSPLAAVGGSAGAGQVVSTTAPQHQGYQAPDISSPLMEALKVSQTNAEIKNQRELMQAQINSLNAEAEAKKYNYSWYSSKNLPVGASMTERLIGMTLQELGLTWDELPKYIKEKFDGINDKGSEWLRDLAPAKVDAEEIQKMDNANESYFAVPEKTPAPGTAPSLDYTGMRYKDALATWKQAYNDMMAIYGDLAYSDKQEAWLKANPKPRKSNFR